MSERRLEPSAELVRLREAKARGPLATLREYARASGPGWLQSAITLGGGSLASSLYLGILAGFSMLWLQPLAMLLGIVMLAAIGYVTLSTGERPFGAIRRHVSPVLGWGWALATLAANVVWSLPQFSLATGVVQQNLLPGTLGPAGPLGDAGGKALVCALVLAGTVLVTWSYGSGRRGVKAYELVLKAVVATIVLCFAGVTLRLGFGEGGFRWGEALAGFVPDLGALSAPAPTFAPFLAAIDESWREYWSAEIVAMQRDVMVAAAATAVGINMTFLLPYSLLSRGWTREHRGLVAFDLSTGMLVPFVLATSCVVIAAASRFHTAPVPGLVEPAAAAPAGKLAAEYRGRLAARLALDEGAGAVAGLAPAELDARVAALPRPEREVAAMLVKRDAFDLAGALRPLTGDLFADVVFGLGVLAMALSTITLLMLISGFVVCEMLGLEPGGWPHRLGSLAAAAGVLGPFLWTKAAVYLAVPTSVFGMMLLPIAYWTFFLMMNSPAVLGRDMPRGRARLVWNALMLPAASVATGASLWSVWSKTGVIGLAAVGAFLALALGVHLSRRRAPRASVSARRA